MKTIIIVILVSLAATSLAARIKIHLEPVSVSKYEAHVLKRQTVATACDDSVIVSRSSLTLPGQLNNLNARVVFSRSQIAMNNVNAFLDMTQVPLMNFTGTTLREVLDVLKNSSCLPFFYGGVVRDQFLGRTPNDADVEIDCPIDIFFDLCNSTWGEVNCGRSPSRPVGHIGLLRPDIENVDVASTNLTFYVPISNLEYTANSIAYDLNGNEVIVDLTGVGAQDACNRSIRIPSDDNSLASWNQWVTDTGGSALLRFWKLRIKGFTAYNPATLSFIVEQSITRLTTRPDDFGWFYCYNVYGANYTASSRACFVSNSSVCSDNMAKAQLYDFAFAEDFGDYWNDTIQPNLLPTCLQGGSAAMGYSLGLLCALLVFALLL